MRTLQYALLSVLILGLIGCGSVTGHHSFTGNFDANATTTSGSSATSMLVFAFSSTEGARTGTGAATVAPVTFSNLLFTTGSNCFDNSASATATITGTPGGNRTMTMTVSEAGNSATFTMTVGSGNDSAAGTFTLTGGNTLPNATTACVASATGSAAFSRR